MDDALRIPTVLEQQIFRRDNVLFSNIMRIGFRNYQEKKMFRLSPLSRLRLWVTIQTFILYSLLVLLTQYRWLIDIWLH